MKSIHSVSTLLASLLALAVALQPATAAEVSHVTITTAPAIIFLPITIMQHEKLFEKHAKAEGLGNVQVTYISTIGGGMTNDAVLSGALQFAGSGVPPFLTMWSKTVGTEQAVVGLAAASSMPFLLNTRNPDIKGVKDFTAKSRIALPGVKSSNQALFLEMAVAKAFGEADYAKLDSQTVTMAHPVGLQALVSGIVDIDSHFTAPPFQYLELEHPGIHTVLNSYDIMEGAATSIMYWTSRRFHDQNPRTVKVFLAALEEAIAFINKDRRAAAAAYLDVTKEKTTVEFIYKMISDPQVEFTATPKGIMKFANFMNKTGAIKTAPKSLRDVFSPEVHQLPGN